MDQKLLDALVTSMQDMEVTSPNFKGMLYGESGVGKTVMAIQIAQAITPVGKTIIYVDSVEGWVSLLNHKGLTDRVIRMGYLGLSQIAAIVQAFDEQLEPFDKAGCIVLDEASTIARADLDNVVKARAKTTPGKDADVPVLPDMNVNTQRMRMAMMSLLQKDIHVIMCAHIREDTDQRTGKVYTRPDFMPKVSKSLREMLHLVGHVTSAEDTNEDGEPIYKRIVQVYPTTSIVAKTRISGMGVHVTVEELIPATLEWLQGNRETLEVNDPLPDTDSLVKDETEVESSDPDSEVIGIVVQ
jgi:hypothetical protein